MRQRRISWRRVNDATGKMRRVLAILKGIDEHPDHHDINVYLVPIALRLLREALDDLGLDLR